MGDTLQSIRDDGVVMVVNAPVQEALVSWAKAVAKAGVRLLGVPVWLPDVANVVDELTDEADLVVGVTGILSPDQISIAVAAGAGWILSPIADPAIIASGREHGLDVIAGAATPTEVVRAAAAGAKMIALHPVGVMGGIPYFAAIARQLRGVPLLASGGVTPDTAPSFLEAGAVGAIIDQGVFPEANEPAALEVITARAAALVEVCAELVGTPKRASLTEILSDAPPARGPESAATQAAAQLGALGDLLAAEAAALGVDEGAQPLSDLAAGPQEAAAEVEFEVFDEAIDT